METEEGRPISVGNSTVSDHNLGHELARAFREGEDLLVPIESAGAFCRALGFPLTDAAARDLVVETTIILRRRVMRGDDLAAAAKARIDYLRRQPSAKADRAAKARAAKARRALLAAEADA